jgi:ElaB/YqjD/DUF883 family membrane-anchored ribosome-binding protein
MPTPIRVKEEINALKNDADKMVKDISKLSAELTEAGIEQAKAATGEVSKYIKLKMEQLRDKMGEANKLMSNYGNKIDHSVRSNPYAFIGGSIGIGWLLSKMFNSKNHVSH